MSGQGESQLQIERRNIKNKQAKIRKQIEVQQKLRQNKKQKQKTRNINMPIIALVGYTNVGKSAFMNYVMGKQEVESKDLLFQTLKTTSRHVELPSGTKVVLMDTIGFITDLPIQMIDSFKATLEDISHADLVIHLRDISHPQYELQKQSVVSILKQLKFNPQFYTQKMVEVWNKVDLVQDQEQIKQIQDKNKQIFKVSCKTGRNMYNLLNFIDNKLKKIRNLKKQKITYGFEKHHLVIEWLRVMANISSPLNEQHHYETTKQYPKGSVTIEIQVDQIVQKKLKKYLNQIGNKQNVRDKSRKGLPPKQGW